MTKYDDIIYEIAVDNYGLVTSAEAREAGVTNNELVQYARRGRIERVGQGVYRIARRIPEPNDAYTLAVALVGPGAYLYGEAVLGMLELCPVNPPTFTSRRRGVRGAHFLTTCASCTRRARGRVRCTTASPVSAWPTPYERPRT